MASHKQIKVRIFPDGKVQAEVTGVPGKKCTDYISVLEDLLDAEVIESEYTSEYYLETDEHTEIENVNQSSSEVIQGNKT